MVARKKKRTAKKPYRKPVLRRVNIGAGVQTLGLGCKTIDGGGSLPVAVPCWADGCAQEGS
ncbi:MAG: hypothetical protein JXO51_10645 [Candidatus Aminicenantes bacterium]|nr:hypothetical protein [Candidatus Aminicenantes bacterium]